MTSSAVVVGIATFKRPGLLKELLESLRDQQDAESFDVLVVDNDPECSARQTVEEFAARSPLTVRYLVEGRPGIAAARNKVLEHSQTYDRLLIIDDDEVAGHRWIASSLEGLDTTGATMVHGEVRYAYPQGTPRWITEGGYFINPVLPNEAELPFAATNNLAIDLVKMRALGNFRFDDQLGLAGGSDLLFTGTVHAAGGVIKWWPAASVTEIVPPERVKPRWVLTRAIRAGESQANSSLLRGRPSFALRLSLMLYAITRLVGGAGLAAVGLLTANQGRCGTGLRHVLRGVGFIRAILGYRVQEYQRRDTD
ncbi:hypothetical protein GCM10022215_04180 [Nocardioides fonticola]|uniref:Glycosyltransferase 2-like domain-containing protein n=1 Tax=Nocardioides fonticola TaxID=450363 RepID=A0ABP7XAS1_9ACTN